MRKLAVALPLLFLGCPDGNKATVTVQPVVPVEAVPKNTPPPVTPDGVDVALSPIGDWKPRVDGAAVLFEKAGFPPNLRVVTVEKPLASLDDVKAAMPALKLGDPVVGPRKDARGWYAAVTSEKRTVFVCLQKLGVKTVLVTGDLTKHGSGDTLVLEDALKLAEALQAKP